MEVGEQEKELVILRNADARSFKPKMKLRLLRMMKEL